MIRPAGMIPHNKCPLPFCLGNRFHSNKVILKGDLNESYKIAKKAADDMDFIVIPGAEITRSKLIYPGIGPYQAVGEYRMGMKVTF